MVELEELGQPGDGLTMMADSRKRLIWRECAPALVRLAAMAPRPAVLSIALLASCGREPPPASGQAVDPVVVEPAAAAGPWTERAEQALAEAGVPGSIVIIDLEHDGAVAIAERAGHVEHPAAAPRSPGSTVKPFLALAAIHERVIEPDDEISCDGVREIDGQTFTCFDQHGPLSLGPALSTSCNEFAYELATRLGLTRIHQHLAVFGFEDGGGVVPEQPLTAAHAAVVGVGHGELLVSPIALAHAYAALATGVAAREHAAAWSYTAEELATIRTALHGVVHDERGTGTAAAVPGLTILGKTGTTDDGDGRTPYRLAYFAGWAPADDPQLIVVVQLEGGTGGDDAAPVARRLFAQLGPSPK